MRKFLVLLTCLFCWCCKNSNDPIMDQKQVIIPPPDIWWNDQVFYEIFVRSFYDSNFDGKGDLQGLIKKLDYLNDGNPATDTDLGVTALWLMPIYPSPSYHGYDVTNYRDVNPDYGTLADLSTLVSEAHRRGIKVILDFVPNHTSDQHPWFKNQPGWYIWSGSNPGYLGPWGQEVWHSGNGGYYYGIFSGGMPDLNYKNADVTTEIKSITSFWHHLGIDGFRMDAAPLLIEEYTLQFNTESTRNWWRDYYAFQKNLDPSFMTVGEVWTSTAEIKPYADQRLDYCFEFDLAYTILDAVRNSNPNELALKMKEVVDSYPPLQFGTFLTNHDQDRSIEVLGLDFQKAKAAAGILLSLPGVPYIYYGEEIGMRGTKPDPNLRLPLAWTSIATQKADSASLWNHYQRLIKIRLNTGALKQGNYTQVTNSGTNVYSFLRIKDDDAVLAIHNLQPTGNANVLFTAGSSSLLPATYQITELLSGSSLGTTTIDNGGGFSVSLANLPGYSTQLVRFRKQ